MRIAPDGATTVIAGNGVSDPSITAQYGTGTDLQLTVSGISTTPNDGLLLTSGRVVYRLSAPGDA